MKKRNNLELRAENKIGHMEKQNSLDLRVKNNIGHGKKGYCLIKKAESRT